MAWRDWPAATWQRFLSRLAPTQPRPVLAWVPGNRRFAFLVVAATGGGLVFDTWLVSCGYRGCPGPAQLAAYVPPEGGQVLDRNGRLIGRLHAVNRVNVPLTAVPRHVRQAFIATEDRRFERHHGVDARGFLRSVARNIRALRVREGFSTITMQVARNAFLSDKAALDRSLGRKLIEVHLAQHIERHLSKDRILELYLNEIYLGNGVYGVEAASRDLFGKGVRQLSVPEGALLAALPKGPSAYTPKQHPDRARLRRDLVLGLMRREGYLGARAHGRARAQGIRIMERDWRAPQPNESYALDAVRSFVDSVLHAAGEVSDEVTVQTTLDLVAQRAAERSVRSQAGRIEGDVWWSGSGERVQGAMVAIDPRDGAIRALVGGRVHERQGFNRALLARRQPGSAFKPFVYAVALASGYTPATVVDDEPLSIMVGNDEWTPANYGDEYRGPVTMRQALAQSANAATVRISRAVGERRVVDMARRNGIASEMRVVPAVALGAVEVTPLELVTAYAPFANGGLRVHPRLVLRIARADGRVLYTAGPPAREVVMDPVDAFQVTSMLRSVVDEGTGRAVRSMGVTGAIAGKTGTTNGGSDAWFVGYTPNLVAGFWFGYDQPRPMGEAVNGGRYAAPAWAEFYRSGWRESNPGWVAPAGLVAVDIDAESGKLAGDWCGPRRREWFRPGTAPTEPCEQRHVDFDVTGLLEHLDDEDWRPLARSLRRLIER